MRKHKYNTSSVRQQIATLANRPIRLGFIIKRDIDAETLRQVFQYNCAVWGGRLNLFVPTDGTELSNDWWRLLYAHDPDILIYVGEISNQLADKLYEWILPFYHFRWTDSPLKQINLGQDTHSVSIWTLLRQQYRDGGKLDIGTSNCYWPVIGDTKYKQFFEIAYGLYPPNEDNNRASLEDAYKDLLGAYTMPCTPVSFEEYLTILDNFTGKITPLRFTGQLTQQTYNGFFHVPPTLVVSNELLDDLFLYHVLHWSDGLVPVVFAKADDLIKQDNLQRLAGWLGQKIRGNMLTIASNSISLETLRNLRDELRPHLPERKDFLGGDGWFISVSTGNFEWSILTATSNKRQQLLNIDGQYATFLPELSFDEVLDPISNWITEIDLIPHAGRKDGFKPSMFPNLNVVLSGASKNSPYVFPNWQRITRGVIGKRVSRTGEIDSIYLPSSNQLIEEIMAQTDGEPSLSTLGRYCHGIVDVLGGLENARFIKNEYTRKLFYELSDERYNIEKDGNNQNTEKKVKRVKAYTYEQMLSLIKPPKEYHAQFKDQLALFAEDGVFIRGSNLQCTECALTAWYGLSELAESIICKGCYAPFQVPVDKKIEFAFQLNPLFFEGFSQGASCVLLTALLLHSMSEKGMMWRAGCTINKDKKVDAEYDLVATCDGCLVVAECKTFFAETTLLPQLKRNIDFAERIGANIFLFATQREDIPASVIDFLNNEDANREKLRVRLVIPSELYEGCLFEEEYDDDGTRQKITHLHRLLKRFPPYVKGLSENDPRGIGGMLLH